VIINDIFCCCLLFKYTILCCYLSLKNTMHARKVDCDRSKPIIQLSIDNRYVFCNLDSLDLVQELVKGNPDWGVYEIIKPELDCKLFFDIDKIQSEEEFEKILKKILDAFQLERERCYIWVCRRINKPLSFHIVVEDSKIADFPCKQNGVKATFERYGINADPCVYSRDRAFRVPFSIKRRDDPYPFLPYDKDMREEDAYYSLIQSSRRNKFPLKTIRLATPPLQACLQAIDPVKGYIIQIEELNGARYYKAFQNKEELLEFWQQRDVNKSYHEVILGQPRFFLDIDHKTEEEAKKIVSQVRRTLSIPYYCKEVWYRCEKTGGIHVIFPNVLLKDYPIPASCNKLSQLEVDTKVYENNSHFRLPYSGPKYYSNEEGSTIFLTNYFLYEIEYYVKCRNSWYLPRSNSSLEMPTEDTIISVIEQKLNLSVTVRSIHERLVNIVPEKPYVCPISKKIHESENPFLRISPNNKKITFYCRRCKSNKELAI